MMKKARKLLALITLVMFVFTTFSFSVNAAGAFSDVEPTHQYAEAIQKLYDDKIVDGYLAEDGSRTFMPDNTITRAEFAKLLAVSLVPDQGILTAMPTGFGDVDKDEKISWAIPYISYAVQSKIVSGYPDGTFQPFKEVTYAEAVKMVVCALGYGAQVEATDPWYEGYLKMGRNVGALDKALSDANSPSKRGLVAQLIMNLKNVQERNSKIPVILPDLGGNSGSSGGTLILPDEDETIEDEGQITALFEQSLSGKSVNLSRNEIMIDDKKYTLDSSINYQDFTNKLGYDCEFEYIESSRRKTIKKIKMKDDFTIYEIKDEDLIENLSPTLLEFYKNESDSKTTKLKLSNMSVIYNGYGVDEFSEEEILAWLTPSNGTVKLLDNGNNKTVDVAFVERFETYFVGAVAIDSYTVSDLNFKDGNLYKSITLDPDDDVVFKTEKGTESNFSAIKKNVTTISVLGPHGGADNYPGVETKTTVIISKSNVKGVVTAYDSATDKYTINSKEYKASPYYNDMIEDEEGRYADQKISIGDSATFYLDHLGRIVYVATNDSSRYGYITSVEIPARENKNEYIISMVINSGEGAQVPTEFTLRDKVTINGKDYQFDEAVARLKESADLINSYKDETARNAEYSQPIIFKTTVEGGTVIKSITTIAVEDAEGESGFIEYDKGILQDETERSEYSSNVFKNPATSQKITMKFGTSSSNPTKVFVVPNNRSDVDDYAVYTKSSEAGKYFIKGNTYLVEGFNVSTTNAAEIVVIYGATPLVIDGNTPAYIVRARNKAKNTDEDEDAFEFEMYELGKKNPDPTILTTLNRSIGADIKSGDIIKFALRGKYIGAIEKVFVGGELYEPFNGDDVEGEQDVAEGFRIDESYSETARYYTSFVGIPYELDGTTFNLFKGFEVTIPGDEGEEDRVLDEESETYSEDVLSLVNDERIENLAVGSSSYVYIFDSTLDADQRVKFANTDSVYSITQYGIKSASRVYAYRISGGTIKCIVVYKNADF